jgi:hypothetical protein
MTCRASQYRLRVGGGGEDGPLVLLQDLEPVFDVSRVILTGLRLQAEVGGKERDAQLCHQFFGGVAFIKHAEIKSRGTSRTGTAKGTGNTGAPQRRRMERAARCPDGGPGYKGEALRKTAKGDSPAMSLSSPERLAPQHKNVKSAKTGGVADSGMNPRKNAGPQARPMRKSAYENLRHRFHEQAKAPQADHLSGGYP